MLELGTDPDNKTYIMYARKVTESTTTRTTTREEKIKIRYNLIMKHTTQ